MTTTISVSRAFSHFRMRNYPRHHYRGHFSPFLQAPDDIFFPTHTPKMLTVVIHDPIFHFILPFSPLDSGPLSREVVDRTVVEVVEDFDRPPSFS